MLDVLSTLAPLVLSFRRRSECAPFQLIPSIALTGGRVQDSRFLVCEYHPPGIFFGKFE